MPKVGKGLKAVHYPYSQRGIKDAMAHSQRTGEPVSMEYGHGGMVPRPKYNLGGIVPPRPMPRPVPRPMPGTGMTPPVNPGTMGGAPGAGASVGRNRMGVGRKMGPIGGYRKGGKVKKR